MTILDQPSMLSKEELEGLLGTGAKRQDDDNATLGSDAGNHANLPIADVSSLIAATAEGDSVSESDSATETATAAGTVDEQKEDFRMVLSHWERTVAGLQQELIELRSRVSRLEQQLAEESSEPKRTLAATGQTAPDADAVRSEDEPSALSRVRTYRSKRGWF